MSLSKSSTKRSLVVIISFIAFCHLACLVTLIANSILNMVYFYGLYLLSLVLVVFFIQSIFFIKYEDYIVETFCGLLFANLVSLFFLIPTAFMTMYNNIGIDGVDYNPQLISLTFFLTLQIILQSTGAGILMYHISYFNIFKSTQEQSIHNAESDGFSPSKNITETPQLNN